MECLYVLLFSYFGLYRVFDKTIPPLLHCASSTRHKTAGMDDVPFRFYGILCGRVSMHFVS